MHDNLSRACTCYSGPVVLSTCSRGRHRQSCCSRSIGKRSGGIIPVGVKADPSLWRNAWTRLGRERRHGQVETYGNWYHIPLGQLSMLH